MKKNTGPAKKPAHRPPKYGEPTEMLHTRVPKSQKEKVRKLVADYLKQFEK